MKTKLFIGLLASGLMLIIACDQGAQKDEPVEKAQEKTEEIGQVDDKTAEILTETASMNMMNMELSKIAEERAVTPEVQKLAQEIETAHSEIKQDLESLAQKEPVVLPNEMSQDHRDKIDNVTDKEGMDFDKEYVDEIKNVHQDKIDEFETLARDSDNPEVREFAINTLPKLRMQLEKAERVENQLNEGGGDVFGKDNEQQRGTQGKTNEDRDI